ncbi:MAG: hypothetical protein IBX69_16180, partial [Anaerolineales bacterium]|nr:hypothetical protein [Anaerolineales bacterium]
DQLGEYHATLRINNDTPYGRVDVPVTMIVVEFANYGVDLVPAEVNQTGEAGETVEYSLTLTNSGDVTDTFDVTYAGNLWDVHLSQSSFTLNPDESAEVFVHVTIPAGALPADVDTAVVSATSQTDGDVSASSTLTTTVFYFYAVELVADEVALSGEFGETVEFILTLTNAGNVVDSFEITFEGNLWDVHLPETSFDLDTGESVAFVVHVTVPADADDGDFDVVTVTATSAGEPDQFAAVELTTTAIPPEWFNLYTPLVFRN